MSQPGSDSDAEVLAIRAVANALGKCTVEQQARVIEWARSRYGSTTSLILGLTEGLVEARKEVRELTAAAVVGADV